MRLLTRELYQRLQNRLERLYGDEAPRLMRRFEQMIGRYGIGVDTPEHRENWSEKDVVLITYADMVQAKGEVPLKTLHRFLQKRLKGTIRVVHLLPFFPWSSDDGFSVVDYRKVNSDYGSWEDVRELSKEFDLMFDLVLNHCSRESSWFRDFVTGIAPARWYFLPIDPNTDLSSVVRPRPWPLLSRTWTREGEKWVWTTFSEDQVDLNWQNPDVLFEFLDILFWYLKNQCRIFRLDAVAFLWKKVGTSCLHLPETHEIVKLFRDVLDIVAPNAAILTETNVPHEENIAYFGNGDEAHMVYNFTLPPLLLYTMLRQDAGRLTKWAQGLPDLPPGQTFLNFSASHDGIGVRPIQGILPQKELKWLISQVDKRGGRISEKVNSDGSRSPYELNITYYEACRYPGDDELSMARFLSSQALVLAFKGMPAVYFNSLMGAENDEKGAASRDQNRAINRYKWDLEGLENKLREVGSCHARIFARYQQWLRKRRNKPAFHPDAPMRILDWGGELFTFLRHTDIDHEKILCIFNVTEKPQEIRSAQLKEVFGDAKQIRNLLNGNTYNLKSKKPLTLPAFYAGWFVLGRD